MINSKHALSYCRLCEQDVVICATCNNNCCNGGYGEIDGQKCHDCPEAYDHQDLYFKDPANIKFAKIMEEPLAIDWPQRFSDE